MQDYSCSIEIGRIGMDAVRDFFLKNEEFMLRLVENPMVFEHKSFTDLCIDHNMVAIPTRSLSTSCTTGRNTYPSERFPACGTDHHHRVG
jgi:hypothetical protein